MIAIATGLAAHLGGPALLRDLKVAEPEVLADKVSAWKWRGAAVLVLYVVREDKVRARLSLDAVRPESHHAVAELHRLGRRVVMITGDARQVAEAVAAELGIDSVSPLAPARTWPSSLPGSCWPPTTPAGSSG